jgi:hypothetical protein
LFSPTTAPSNFTHLKHLKQFHQKPTSMQKTIMLCGLLFSLMCHLNAQSINNTWKAYIADPINDTAIFHIDSDSSFIASAKGGFMIRTRCNISGDTLTILDYGTEQQSCPDAKGTYKIKSDGKSLTFTLIDDSCEGRARALAGRKWTATKQ